MPGWYDPSSHGTQFGCILVVTGEEGTQCILAMR